jgi:hypothetical protein
MPNTIQLQLSHLLLILCIFLFLTFAYINYIKYLNKDDKSYKYSDNIINKINKKVLKLDKYDEYDIERHNFLNKRDRNVLEDRFTKPERRVPEYIYPYEFVKKSLNIPTRGYPENFSQFGIVIRDGYDHNTVINTNTNKHIGHSFEQVYRLYGRQVYPGSSQYEYYIQGSINDNSMKIPIKVKGDKEFMNNDIIHIPGTSPDKGEFRVNLFKLDIPRYNPYLNIDV